MAVNSNMRNTAVNALGLRLTGEYQELNEADLTAVQLPTGWFLLTLNRGDDAIMDNKLLTKISAHTELIHCMVIENMMSSYVSSWQNGREVWSVVHYGDQDIEHLEAKGNLPANYQQILDRALTRQAESGGKQSMVDYIFEVPVELAESVTGYRHDKVLQGLTGKVFETLARTDATPKRSWFRKILGF